MEASITTTTGSGPVVTRPTAGSGPVVTPGRRCVLLKVGELALKRKNRGRFVARLHDQIARAMDGLDGVQISERAGVVAVRADDPEAALERARDVIGISLLHPALAVPRSPEAASEAAIELLRGRAGESFAIRARRRDKSFPMISRELATRVGAAVQSELGLAVDLTSPDLEVHLEVDRKEIFAYGERIPGRGGLPVGSSGRALVLLSGGIDSPVAAYRMMRRGLRCDFVHFSGRPFTGSESIYKAYALVRALDRFQHGSRLFVVPFGHAQKRLAASGAGRLQVLGQRRLMVRVACALAEREGAEALVTGDSLGQVSSQTLRNLAVVEAASDLPLLRPLVDRDKAEVIAEAERLGTMAISTLPDEDCCTLFASPFAETRADPADLDRLEKRVEAGELIEELVAELTPVEVSARG
jgi:thiamine biosynthesis protein ThiI